MTTQPKNSTKVTSAERANNTELLGDNVENGNEELCDLCGRVVETVNRNSQSRVVKQPMYPSK